jgi:serine/threonine protein kinase
VQVYDLVESNNGDAVLIMSLVDGGPLSKLPLPLPWTTAVRYLIDACHGLEELHKRGLLHRDIKPSNLLLDRDEDIVVVADYGLAAFIDEQSSLAGTSGYMAPELLDEPPSVKADVFALAVTLYALVTGEALFDATNPYTGLLQAREGWRGRASQIDNLPIGVQKVFREGLEPDAKRRPDLPGFLDLLQRADKGALIEALQENARKLQHPVRLTGRLSLRPEGEGAPVPLAEHAAAPGEPVNCRVALAAKSIACLEVEADQPGHISVLHLGSTGKINVLLPGPRRPYSRVGPGQPLPPLNVSLTPEVKGDHLAVVWTRYAVTATPEEWRERILAGELLTRDRGRVTRVRGVEPLYQEDPFDGWAVVMFDIYPQGGSEMG